MMIGNSFEGAEGDGSTVLDLQHLGKYTAGDELLRGELLTLFSEQLACQLSALGKMCTGDDWIMATHTLKGAARAIGAFKIGETAEELEQLDPSTDSQECTRLINRLTSEAQECRAVIEELASAA